MHKLYENGVGEMNGMLILDDHRYVYTQKYLENKGYTFYAEKPLDFIIFPFKEKVCENTYGHDFFANLGPKTLMFSGVNNDYLKAQSEAFGLKYHVMMDDFGTTVKNAVPTSEGVIAYLVQNMQRTIANSKLLVVGYGICGRDLAKRLLALGAKTHALVRNRDKECTAEADGVQPLYKLEECKFDAIVNTVPSQVMTNEMLDRVGDTLMIDIASAPYGFDIEHAKKHNARSALLPGIPGKFAFKTAGETLGEYIWILCERE